MTYNEYRFNFTYANRRLCRSFFYTLHSDQPSCHNFSEDLSKNSIRSFSLWLNKINDFLILCMFFTELNKKLRIRHRVLSRICIRSFYFILFFVFLVYYSCTFLLSRTMIFYSSVTKASSSSASSVSITSSVNAVSSFSKLSL